MLQGSARRRGGCGAPRGGGRAGHGGPGRLIVAATRRIRRTFKRKRGCKRSAVAAVAAGDGANRRHARRAHRADRRDLRVAAQRRDEAGYAAAAAAMDALAATQPGYRGIDSARGADGFGITVSYWADDAAAIAWRDHPIMPRSATRAARAGTTATQSTVARVERGYDWRARMIARVDRALRADVPGDADDRGGQHRAAIGAARARPVAGRAPTARWRRRSRCRRCCG